MLLIFFMMMVGCAAVTVPLQRQPILFSQQEDSGAPLHITVVFRALKGPQDGGTRHNKEPLKNQTARLTQCLREDSAGSLWELKYVTEFNIQRTSEGDEG